MVQIAGPVYTERMKAKAATLKVRRSGTGFLVKSGSEEGVWYKVTRPRCECEGFRYRGICSHVLAVRVGAEA